MVRNELPDPVLSASTQTHVVSPYFILSVFHARTHNHVQYTNKVMPVVLTLQNQ